MVTEHDESKLPKWAQKELDNLRMEISLLQALKQAHYILEDKEWFVLPIGDAFKEKDHRYLYLIERDYPNRLCSIGKDDVILIGRNCKE